MYSVQTSAATFVEGSISLYTEYSAMARLRDRQTAVQTDRLTDMVVGVLITRVDL
jgi:hypothetical protein